MRSEPYPSDLTDARWAILEPSVPPAHELVRPRETDLRKSHRRHLRPQPQWLRLAGAFPRLSPPWRTVHNYFRKWRDDGTWGVINDTLRGDVRRRAGRDPTPSAGNIDSQTVKASEVGGPVGYDGGKRPRGRKRHIVVDTPGQLLAVTVTTASAHDGTAAPRMRAKLSREFKVIKWRRVVERTFAWPGRCRIHSRDYERKIESSEAQVQISMIQLMLRRLAGEKYGSPFRYPRPAYKIAA